VNHPASVLIATAHPLTRLALRTALQDEGFRIVAEVETSAEAVECAVSKRPDVCLLDADMSDGGAIGACSRITATLPDTFVLMLTGRHSENDLFASLIAGASGYMSKDVEPSTLPQTIRGVLQGEAALSPELVAKVIAEFRSQRGGRLAMAEDVRARLTGREWEVLQLMRHDLGTAEIAARMFVSTVTVRSHIASVLRKMKLPDRSAVLTFFDGEPEAVQHPLLVEVGGA
jgi:DNA-binding NarL/FixJ family response regulator